MTITEFLTARYDEDEADVKGHAYDYIERDTGVSKCRHLSHVSGWPSTCWRAQVSARVLADIAAKRAIVALHSGTMACYWTQDSMAMHEPGEVCETLALLAQPFADHPNFDESWKP